MKGVSMILGCAVLIGGTTLVATAGELGPPTGSITPTMKTLDQIEARIPLNQQTAPGNSTSVLIIRESGSYYLTGDVTGQSGKFGITIHAQDVTLDLNGFAVRGVPGSFSGIVNNGTIIMPSESAPLPMSVRPDGYSLEDEPDENETSGNPSPPPAYRINLLNGLVIGWDLNAIDLRDSIATRIESLQVTQSTGSGIVVGENALIRNCHVTHNGGHAIDAGPCLIASQCTLIDNEDGIHAASGANISNCTLMANRRDGIHAGPDTVATECTVIDSGRHGIHLAECALVARSLVRSSAAVGIHTGSHSNVTENVSVASGALGISCAGTSLIRANMCTSINGAGTSHLIDNY